MPLIEDALGEPEQKITYKISAELKRQFADRAVIEGNALFFDLSSFAHDGNCTIEVNAREHPQLQVVWDRDQRLWHVPVNIFYDVTWDGEHLSVLYVAPHADQGGTYFWILARTVEIAERFYLAVCKWVSEIRGEILVFEGGCWQKDEGLYHDIAATSLDNLVLRADLKTEIVNDLKQFFVAKDLYQEYGIPWKRGVLFLGPPGNGKTFAIKGLINELKRSCLYVKSFDLPGNAFPQAGISEVFSRARHSTPCILVLEDLDALIGEHNRSFFLNELDGFALNSGILTIATCNHPERLDPAILDRPSRFDRKYHFQVPGDDERSAYVAHWNSTLRGGLYLTPEEQRRIVEATADFSFAYVKELFLSSMMRWASDDRSNSFASIMMSQVDTLREQMSSARDERPPSLPGHLPMAPEMFAMMSARHGFGGWSVMRRKT